MKQPNLLLRLVAVGFAILLTGCEAAKQGVTGSLWSTHHSTHFREPAPDPQPAVYYAPAQQDFLVSYTSLLDGDRTPRRQNYFVLANEELVAKHKKPEFISTNRLQLVSVPLNAATNVFPHASYESQLTIHTRAARLGPYPLPNYKETEGTAMKSALTPLAVAGDVTIVGFVIGAFVGFAWWGGGGGSFNTP